MSEETKIRLDEIYEELRQARDEIGLKLHLGSMELRDQWNELEGEWESWTHQLGKDLKAKGEDLEKSLREAGGEDLRKLETKTKLAVSKLKRGFREIAQKLGEE